MWLNVEFLWRNSKKDRDQSFRVDGHHRRVRMDSDGRQTRCGCRGEREIGGDEGREED